MDAAWKFLVSTIEDDVDGFVDSFVKEFHRRQPYGQYSVDEKDLRHTSQTVFRVLIVLLKREENHGEPIDAQGVSDLRDLWPKVDDFGRNRARQGVAIGAVMEIMRIDFVILWNALAARATEETKNALIAHALDVQFAVDELSERVRQAFMKELSRIENDARVASQRYLELLFGRRLITDREFSAVAQGLGTPLDAKYSLAIAGPRSARAMEREVAPLLASGQAFGSYLKDCFCAFWEADCSPNAAEELLSSTHYYPVTSVVFEQLRGLEGVRGCIAGAIEMATVVERNDNVRGPIAAQHALVIALSERAYSLMPAFIDDKVNALLALNPKERANLVETVEAYFREGSIKATATKIFCHRNTVINRLKGFHEVTGLSPLVPSEIFKAEIVLARLAGVLKTRD
ncbi:helix-turn-helix domain-containing protein [Corynebacterium flavescens]